MSEKIDNKKKSSNDTIHSVMQRAFYKMLENQPVKLSKLGALELNDCWENSHKDKWFIQAIHVDDKITLCSEYHSIFRNAPLTWLVLHGA